MPLIQESKSIQTSKQNKKNEMSIKYNMILFIWSLEILSNNINQ